MKNNPENKPILYLDSETFSETDIKTAGSVKYADDTEMLLCGFELDGKYDFYDYSVEGKDRLPQFAIDHILDGGWVCAHNALFDYVVLKKHISELKIDQMIDSMAICAAYALPLALGKACKALGLEVEKYGNGSTLVRKFCVPRNPTKNNPNIRNHAWDFPKDWDEFRDNYLHDDVYSMKGLVEHLGLLPPEEQRVWLDTQRVNLHGVPVDVDTAEYIANGIDKLVDFHSSEFIRITGLFPTQRDKVLGWVRKNGVKILNLQASTVEEVLADESAPEDVRRALEHRANTTHMSFKKYNTILAAAMKDGRVRGTLMYHVATTGRFGGRLLQTQNLTRGTIDGEEAVERIHAGEFNVELVKSAVRPMISSPAGFTIVDYSGIEARVLQLMSMDRNALQIFFDGLDPYKVMAAEIYGVPYEEVDSKQRFFGKQAILGLGYQMSAKKFIMMVESYGETISLPEAQRVVDAYRKLHAKTVNLWEEMETAALRAMANPGAIIRVNRHVSFGYSDDEKFLYMRLPSGRLLSYYEPVVEPGGYHGDKLSFMGMNEKNQWVRQHTYGGKLTENLVQAFARDLLTGAISRLIDAGYGIATHIHDEIVVEGTYPVEEIAGIMCELPVWAEGLPLDAEGFNSSRFKKG